MKHALPTSQLTSGTLDGLRRAAAAQQTQLVAQRRAFHANPELGWQEVETTAAIVADLQQTGFDVVSGAAFLGDVEKICLLYTSDAADE